MGVPSPNRNFHGLDDSYYRIPYQYWMTSPATGLQLAYIVLFGCVLALRVSRNIRERRAALRIT